jgi:hypothetical protein
MISAVLPQVEMFWFFSTSSGGNNDARNESLAAEGMRQRLDRAARGPARAIIRAA